MNLIFENDTYTIKANGQTRTYSDIETATAIFEMMTQERIGYNNAHKPDFEPVNDHQRNGVDAWFEEQATTAAALRAFNDGLDGVMIFA